jgi:hypothetical protein
MKPTTDEPRRLDYSRARLEADYDRPLLGRSNAVVCPKIDTGLRLMRESVERSSA